MNRFTNAPPGLFFDGDPGFPFGTGMNKRWWNFAPRLGFAWDVNGDGRTSVRASAGIFYDHPTAIYLRDLTTVPPWASRTDLQNVDLANPWATFPGGDPGLVPAGGNAPKNIPWQLNNITTAMDYADGLSQHQGIFIGRSRHARQSPTWRCVRSGALAVRRCAFQNLSVQRIAESEVSGGGVQCHEQLPNG